MLIQDIHKHHNPPRVRWGVEPTRLIVCGTRTFDNYTFLRDKLEDLTWWFDDVALITGRNKTKIGVNRYAGADYLAEKWAFEQYNWYVSIGFVPDWERHGKAAGPMRNEEMAAYAAAGPDRGYCVAFWDGSSPGTRSMIDLAKKYKLRLKVYTYGA